MISTIDLETLADGCSTKVLELKVRWDPEDSAIEEAWLQDFEGGEEAALSISQLRLIVDLEELQQLLEELAACEVEEEEEEDIP